MRHLMEWASGLGKESPWISVSGEVRTSIMAADAGWLRSYAARVFIDTVSV